MLPPYPDTRMRWLILCIVLFFGFIFFTGNGMDRPARVRTGVPFIALSLLCLSRFFWIFFEVARRRRVDWRFKRFTGVWVLRMAYPLAGASVFFGLMAIVMLGAWAVGMLR